MVLNGRRMQASILEQESHVADAVLDSQFGVHEVRRSAHINFHAIERNNFEPLASTVIRIGKPAV
jgi:hypothetical protein